MNVSERMSNVERPTLGKILGEAKIQAEMFFLERFKGARCSKLFFMPFLRDVFGRGTKKGFQDLCSTGKI